MWWAALLGIYCDPFLDYPPSLILDFIAGILSFKTASPWFLFMLAHVLDSVSRLEIRTPMFWIEQLLLVFTMLFYGLIPHTTQ
jgi:hypothetical protein